MNDVLNAPRLGLVLTLGAGILPARLPAAAAVEAQLATRENRLEISVTGMPRGPHELRMITRGIRAVETSADVKEPGVIYLPPPREDETAPGPAELVFFFHQFRPADGWELVVQFDPAMRGTWSLNGDFSALSGTVEREVSVPVSRLESGENLLHVRSATPAVPEFFYRYRLPEEPSWHGQIDVLPGEWAAEVSLWPAATESAQALVVETVGSPPFRRSEVSLPNEPWRDRAAVRAAALAVGRNVLRSRVDVPHSRLADGFHLVYDARHAAPRMSHWVWSWGPPIELLFALEKLCGGDDATLAASFRAAAEAASRRSLEFEVTTPDHPARGVSTVRWEPARASADGWVEYISTADSLFLAGWGWMSAFEATKDPVFLERTRSLVAAAARLMDQYPVVPQDWIVDRGRWTPHTLDESVFGLIGFRALHEAEPSDALRALAARFLDSHLEHMARDEALLERGWLREEDKAIWGPDIKGHGWVMEGYLDGYRLTGNERYRQRALALADRVLACQGESGAWTYAFRQPRADDPLDDKATAIWSYLLYDLYGVTGDPVHLAAARRALAWCWRHQYRGEDPMLDGAIFQENSMIYIGRRPMTILYSTVFFGLALLEELALSPESPLSSP